MASLNVAHATGYPLFTLMGYAWLQIPLAGAAAWRLNLISAIFGAATIAMVFVLSRSITRRLDAALIASIFVAVAPVFWFNASILEVYSLNALFLALIIFLLFRWAEHPASNAPLYFAFFTLGLALAHHRMVVLALPGIFVFLLLTEHRFLLNWRRLIIIVLLLVPGLTLYLYVPLRLVAAGETLHYAYFDIILGQEFSASLFREYHFEQVLWEIPFQNFNLGLILAAVGGITLFRSKRNLAVFLLLVYLANVVFGLAYWVPDVEVFLTPSFVIIALWVAIGAKWLIEWLGAHFQQRFRSLASLSVSILLILYPFVGLEQYPTIVARVSREAGNAEPRARSILVSGLPPGAMLELDWETATAIRFLQTTEGARRDLEARLIKINERNEYNWVLQNVDSGRPVFVEHGVNWTRAAAGYQVQSAPADLAQIVRAPVDAQSVTENIDDHVQLEALRNDSHALVLFWRVRKPLERDLATFVHFFDAEGRPLGQEDHAACCEAIYGYRTTEWEVGREVADTFRAAPTGTSYLQIGMYSLNNGDIEPYGRNLAIQTETLEVPTTAEPLGIGLGKSISASAYELSNNGKSVKLTVYWQALAGVPKDYSVFVHALDAGGKILQQVDRQPLNGAFPTSAWKSGQTVFDTFTLPSSSDLAKLEFGLYDAANGVRVARADGKGDSITIDLK